MSTSLEQLEHRGQCLCGSVKFVARGKLEAPTACHCSQCRKQSGHYWASTSVAEKNLQIDGSDNVGWYQSSEKVQRGFCKHCGSFLFWNPATRDDISIAMGAFDTPTETQLALHIFVADKGDYYTIADGLPQNEQ